MIKCEDFFSEIDNHYHPTTWLQLRISILMPDRNASTKDSKDTPCSNNTFGGLWTSFRERWLWPQVHGEASGAEKAMIADVPYEFKAAVSCLVTNCWYITISLDTSIGIWQWSVQTLATWSHTGLDACEYSTKLLHGSHAAYACTHSPNNTMNRPSRIIFSSWSPVSKHWFVKPSLVFFSPIWCWLQQSMPWYHTTLYIRILWLWAYCFWL